MSLVLDTGAMKYRENPSQPWRPLVIKAGMNWESMADTYDPDNGTYEVGQYVLEEGMMYRCIYEITTPEAWTPAHWTSANVADELASFIIISDDQPTEDSNKIWIAETTSPFGVQIPTMDDHNALGNTLNQQISDMRTSLDTRFVSIPFTAASNGLIRASNGTAFDNNTTYYTDYIDLSPYNKIKYKHIISTAALSGDFGVAFYDSNKNYVDGIVAYTGETVDAYVEEVSLIPVGAKYARFSYFADSTLYGEFSLSGSLKSIGVELGTESSLSYQGSFTLSSEDFENGKMTASNIVRANDARKSLVFLCNEKLKAGTRVHISLPNDYVYFWVWDRNNWGNGNRTVLQDHPYVHDLDVVLGNDGYIAMQISTDPLSSNQQVMEKEDFEGNITIYPATEPEANNAVYYGERFNLGSHKCVVSQDMRISHSVTTSVQGGACYGDKLFLFEDKFAACAIYDLNTKQLVQKISLTQVSNWHCNSANFGDEFYDQSDFFPLLYVSQEAINTIIVFRVIYSNGSYSLNQVQTISFPLSSQGGLNYANAILDLKRHKIVEFGVRTVTSSAYITLTFNEYNLPLLSSGDVVYTAADITETFDVYTPNFPQGGFCTENRIIMPFGTSANRFLLAIDLTSKSIVTSLNLDNSGADGVFGQEPECAFAYNNAIYIVDGATHVWRLDI